MDQASYETVTSTGCGLLPPAEDGKLLITGAEAAGLLDGQLSNDIAGLPEGSGCEATLLTPKGRILAPVRVLRRPDGLLLLTERETLQPVWERLRSGGLGWDAVIHKQTLELERIELLGPHADAVAAAAGFTVPGDGAEHACTVDAVRTYRGLELLVPAAAAGDARARLLAAGAVPADPALAEIVRVEAGRPRWGCELDESTMPEEAAMTERAVSFTKGCYVGQETVARLHWKGRPNRVLRTLEPAAPVAPGTTISGAGRELGAVGSAVVSPSHGPLALALLRREVEPGDVVDVAGTAAAVR